MTLPDTLTLHASCVEMSGRAVMIMGASGSGKSGLALELMAYGCTLVADDRTILSRRGDVLCCSAPPALIGKIEARFVGILNADTTASATLVLVINLDHEEVIRLPPQRCVSYLGVEVPLINRPSQGHVAAAVLQYLRAGRNET